MKYINNKEKLEEFKKSNNFFAIIDFDRTLSTALSDPTMGIIPKFLGGECQKQRIKNYEYYRPLELNYTIEEKEKRKIMREWAISSFTLVEKYLTSEKIIDESLKDANLYLRPGVKEFLIEMNEKNIPVVIMSAGVGNLIKKFLENQGVLYDNIILVTNYYEFKDDKAYIDTEKIMATSNKDYSKIPEKIRKVLDEKEKILLCGDIVEDIKMVQKEKLYKTLTVGFLDYNIEENLNTYNKNFDIVLTDNSDFNDLKNVLDK